MRDFGDAGFVAGDQINQFGPDATGKVVIRTGGRPEPRTVLILMSDPIDAPRLRLAEEYRAVDRAVAAARHGKQIALRVGMAPQYDDLHDLLLRYRPAVVHYAGHHDSDGIALLDPNGRARTVPATALRDLFAIVKDSVVCVVLNACLTHTQAVAIATHVPCVVGMSNLVPDPVAIEFAVGFHRGIASGRSIADAFELGRNLPALAGLGNEGPRIFYTDGDGAAGRLTITG